MTIHAQALSVTPRTGATNPQVYARSAGLMFLLVILAGMIAEMFVSAQLIATNNPTTTAANILANREVFQFGFAVYLIEMAFYIAMTVPFYYLLRPASTGLALLMVLFSLVGCAIKISSRVFFIAPLVVLDEAQFLNGFTAEQIHALNLVLLQVNVQAAGISLVFLGIATVLKGLLIVQSTFLPRILGAVSIVAGLGWVTFIYPPLAAALYPLILAFALLGSAALIGWLLVKGVNVQRWNEQARAAGIFIGAN